MIDPILSPSVRLLQDSPQPLYKLLEEKEFALKFGAHQARCLGKGEYRYCFQGSLTASQIRDSIVVLGWHEIKPQVPALIGWHFDPGQAFEEMREAFDRYVSLDDVFELGIVGGMAETKCKEDCLLSQIKQAMGEVFKAGFQIQFELTYFLKSTAFESLSVNASINKALSICFHR